MFNGNRFGKKEKEDIAEQGEGREPVRASPLQQKGAEHNVNNIENAERIINRDNLKKQNGHQHDVEKHHQRGNQAGNNFFPGQKIIKKSIADQTKTDYDKSKPQGNVQMKNSDPGDYHE